MSVFAGENHFDVCYPLAYLVTVTCYGRHLHGHEEGSVSTESAGYGTPMEPACPKREAVRGQLREFPYFLDSVR